MPTATRTNPTTPPLVVPVITRAKSLRGVKPIAQPYPPWAQQPAPRVDAVAAPDPDEGDDVAVADLQAPLPPDPAVSRPKVKPMTKPEPLPPTAAGELPASDAVASPTPAGADDLESLLDTLAGPRLKLGLRVHRTRPDGSRGEMLFTVPASEHPDALRERIAKYGPGEYELAPVADGKYSGQARRMVVEAPASSAAAALPVPVAAPAPAGFDVAGLLAGLAGLQRESQAAQAAQFERMQSAAKDSQIETLKLFLSHRPAEGGGSSGLDPMMKMMMPMLLAKFGEDPFARVLQMLEINKAVREDSAPPDRTGEIFANLAGTLPALLAGAQQAAPAALPRRVVSVTPAGQPAATAAAGAAPEALPAAGLQAIVVDALPMLKRMAVKQADAATVLGGLGAMLTDTEVSAVLPMLSQAGAVDFLLTIAPSLAPHREWLDALLTEVRAMIAAEAAPEAASAPAGVEHAAA
ncbi:hypothetical protein [Nevskia ramosa]|uniref:hypothetical protein n=1 Tax=Nevskia ramosa TaxID=64002 RepID=UPI0003B5FA2D|nr:hypothetical protein [Nevskia ramosa]